MKNTYGTYQEAKIKNQDYVIFECNGSFGDAEALIESLGVKFDKLTQCNPADYCVSVERFLDAGHKFVVGDVYMNATVTNAGFVYTVSDPQKSNRKSSSDSVCYVLQSAELSERAKEELTEAIDKMKEKLIEAMDKQKPRTKVEYVNVKSVFELDKDLMYSGNYGQLNGEDFYPALNEVEVVGPLTRGQLYRKVERPVEWWEDAFEFVCNSGGSTEWGNGRAFATLTEDEHLEVHAKMTRDKWCDFARILLEQEGE